MMNVNGEDTDDDEAPNNDNPMVASFAEDVDIDDYIPGQQDTKISPAPNDPSSSDEEPTKLPNDKIVLPKSTLKTKLSNSSSKSGDEGPLHFDLPEHLKATATNNETIVEENENDGSAKKHKKSKKSKEKKHHKKRK